MSVGLQVWSQTAASNSTADTNINWPEGMAPSQVDDSARAVMASMAKWRDDNSGTLNTSGSTTAFTVTSNQVAAANTDGYTIAVKFHATNDSSATLNVDGNGAKNLQISGGNNVVGGEFPINSINRFKYDSASTAWIVQNNPLGSVATNSLLANISGSQAVPTALSIGSGLGVSGTNLIAAFAPTGSFKNLAIKVTGNSSGTVTADYVTMATSVSSATNFQTVALNGSVSISSGLSGAVGGIDVAGSPASGTWYAVWAISTAASTQAQGLLSTSFTSPAMPATYTYRARIGALITSTSTASTVLLGTYQFGRTAQYVVNLAGSGANTLPDMLALSGTVLTTSFQSMAVQNRFIPTTAQIINGTAAISTASIGEFFIAPNNSYLVANQSPPVAINLNVPSIPFTLTLESSAISVAQSPSASGLKLFVRSWEDNI